MFRRSAVIRPQARLTRRTTQTKRISESLLTRPPLREASPPPALFSLARLCACMCIERWRELIGGDSHPVGLRRWITSRSGTAPASGLLARAISLKQTHPPSGARDRL